jgi:hypothetical protein
MGFAVAGIKIVRLIVLQAFSVFVIVPTMTKQMSEAMEQMMSQMPPGPGGAPPPMGAEFATVYGTLMTISAVCMVVFGSIYPIIVLWVLSRPEAKMYSQSVETTK